MKAEKLRRLRARLITASNVQELCAVLAKQIESHSEYFCAVDNDGRYRVILFGQGYTDAMMREIMVCLVQKRLFPAIKELRIVATHVHKSLAEEFKKMSSETKVLWVSGDEWLDLNLDSTDLSSLSCPIPETCAHLLIP